MNTINARYTFVRRKTTPTTMTTGSHANGENGTVIGELSRSSRMFPTSPMLRVQERRQRASISWRAVSATQWPVLEITTLCTFCARAHRVTDDLTPAAARPIPGRAWSAAVSRGDFAALFAADALSLNRPPAPSARLAIIPRRSCKRVSAGESATLEDLGFLRERAAAQQGELRVGDQGNN